MPTCGFLEDILRGFVATDHLVDVLFKLQIQTLQTILMLEN